MCNLCREYPNLNSWLDEFPMRINIKERLEVIWVLKALRKFLKVCNIFLIFLKFRKMVLKQISVGKMTGIYHKRKQF